jgi:L-cysteine desulfidase
VLRTALAALFLLALLSLPLIALDAVTQVATRHLYQAVFLSQLSIAHQHCESERSSLVMSQIAFAVRSRSVHHLFFVIYTANHQIAVLACMR